MSNTLTITPAKICKRVKPGTEVRLEENLVLTKTGGALTGYHGQIDEAKNGQSWFQLSPASFALDPVYPTYAHVKLRGNVPTDAAHTVHTFTVQFTAEDQPADIAQVEVTIQVLRPGQQWLEEHIWLLLILATATVLVLILILILSGHWLSGGTA